MGQRHDADDSGGSTASLQGPSPVDRTSGDPQRPLAPGGAATSEAVLEASSGASSDLAKSEEELHLELVNPTDQAIAFAAAWAGEIVGSGILARGGFISIRRKVPRQALVPLAILEQPPGGLVLEGFALGKRSQGVTTPISASCFAPSPPPNAVSRGPSVTTFNKLATCVADLIQGAQHVRMLSARACHRAPSTAAAQGPSSAAVRSPRTPR